MTRDEIIKMAREAGFDTSLNEVYVWAGQDRVLNELAKFASLVASAEREACAAICDAEGREWDSDDVVTEKNYAAHCAHRIRARGDT